MTRDRYRKDPLSEFSEWHREQPSWYTWIDADYVGYIDPKKNSWSDHAYSPYIIIELIHVSKRQAWDDYGINIDDAYPLDTHKKLVYQKMEGQSNIPTYVVWHPTECDEFVTKRLGATKISKRHLKSESEFLDFLDERRINAMERL